MVKKSIYFIFRNSVLMNQNFSCFFVWKRNPLYKCHKFNILEQVGGWYSNWLSVGFTFICTTVPVLCSPTSSRYNLTLDHHHFAIHSRPKVKDLFKNYIHIFSNYSDSTQKWKQNKTEKTSKFCGFGTDLKCHQIMTSTETRFQILDVGSSIKDVRIF